MIRLYRAGSAKRTGGAVLLVACMACAHSQDAIPVVPPAVVQAAPQTTAMPQGGTIRGAVVAGAAGKQGATPLPGVSITATNTLTGRKYTTATDIDGAYAMVIPRNGRYVVRAELAGFAASTQEVVISGASGTKPQTAAKASDFGLELASRVAAAEQAATTASSNANLRRGLQNLDLNSGLGNDTENASASADSNAGASMPTLGGLGDSADSSDNAIAVSGQTGSTNSLANYSEDEIRQRVQEGVEHARASGMLPPGSDPTNMIVGVLGSMMGGPGESSRGSGRGSHSGRGGSSGGTGGGGFGSFRHFNPAQPHGSVYYQGGNNALNSAPWEPTLLPQVKPAGFQNRFGVSFAGTPYIPGLTKPNTKQFLFLNLTGQKNLNPVALNPVRVPTALERTGDFSQSQQLVNGKLQPVALYNPGTNTPIPGNNLANSTTGISSQALSLLNAFYPTCNVNCDSNDPTIYNYETVTNAGANNVSLNSRFVRSFGQNGGSPFGFSRSGGSRRSGQKTAPSLRQNINLGFNYSHSANDLRNIFLPLGGANESNGYGLNAGYTIGYGRLSNNASVNWNRSSAETRNYFTDTANNPTAAAGIVVPNQTGGFADPNFYNGVPHISISNFAGLNNTSPSQSINQTISFSDSVSWRHLKHNYRFGVDVRRVHADFIGGSNPLGQFNFTGYNTQNKQSTGTPGTTQQSVGGSGLADFLLGLPTSTKIQAGLFKTYLRENVLDAYAQDDFRLMANVTLNYGLRWEYFSPYVEKNNHLANLDHNADFTSVEEVFPGQTGTYQGKFPRSLVNPDRTMFAPRIGVAWRPRPASAFMKSVTHDLVVRGGYGINYNTGQVTTFARQLAFQPPFATTQTNTLRTGISSTGCDTLSLKYGFIGQSNNNCSATAVQNNYAVNPNYRLGLVQVYNLNLQRTLPAGLVLNVGYNGSFGSNLDIQYAANQNGFVPTTPDAQPFLFEDSVAASRMNQLVVNLNKRQFKGIAFGATYVYSHAIDNASSIGGGGNSTVQNPQRLDLEESNSSFDVRHRLTVNWTLESPFGPNRPFLNKGGFMSRVLDGFVLSGNGTFASGSYFTPEYNNGAAQQLAGGYYTPRPDRVFSQPIAGSGRLLSFFNTAAFAAPPKGQVYGTASRNSIEGPGTTSISTSLSRLVQLGETRSFEARITANNVFNTVQYSSIDTVVDSATYGHVLSAASMRTLQFSARYRF